MLSTNGRKLKLHLLKWADFSGCHAAWRPDNESEGLPLADDVENIMQLIRILTVPSLSEPIRFVEQTSGALLLFYSARKWRQSH